MRSNRQIPDLTIHAVRVKRTPQKFDTDSRYNNTK